jgi:CBS domain-containing protein
MDVRLGGSVEKDQIPIAAIMNKQVVSAKEGSTIREVGRLALEHKIAGLPIIDDHGCLQGVISERELLVLAAGTDLDSPIVYCQTPVATHKDTTLKDTILEMTHRKLKWMPVVEEDGTLVGVIARRDILKALLGED